MLLCLFRLNAFKELRSWFILRVLRHDVALDSEGENGLAEGREGIEEQFRMLNTKCRMLFEIGFVFGGGEVVKRGADEAGAVFARGGLPLRQFIAQRQQLLHLRHNPPLFGRRRNGDPSCLGVTCSQSRHLHSVALGVSVADEIWAAQIDAKIGRIDDSSTAHGNDFSRAETALVRNDYFVQVRPQLAIKNIPRQKLRLGAAGLFFREPRNAKNP